MILADTSAVVAYLRASETPADATFTRLVRKGELPLITEPVMLELLAGARSPAALRRLRRFLHTFEIVPGVGLDDNERAADLYRRCRSNGVTIRGLLDCLVAAVAIRIDAELLHEDRDFERLAQHTELRTVAL